MIRLFCYVIDKVSSQFSLHRSATIFSLTISLQNFCFSRYFIDALIWNLQQFAVSIYYLNGLPDKLCHFTVVWVVLTPNEKLDETGSVA